MLKHLLCSSEEGKLETITEIQWFWQYAEELRLLKAHRQPFLNNKFIQDFVHFDRLDLWILLVDGVTQDFNKGADRDWYLTD